MNEQEEIFVHERWYVLLGRRYRKSWYDSQVRFSLPLALLAFAASVVTSFYAIAYATHSASNSVTDIILSNIPIFDVDGLMIVGTTLLIAVIVLLFLDHPRRLPFGLYALTLFFFIRSGFTVVTHIASYPLPASTDFNSKIFQFFFGFGGDLFFSAHTAVPFLMALCFWNRPRLRYLFLAWSVFFGVVVLLGHLHYTIDVLSAFFITYGIFQIAVWWFPAEWALFLAED
jgi:hypothetical protein